jgi:very-short-patch-repair endonuclease
MIAGSTLPLPDPQIPIHDEDGVFVARPDFLYRKEKLIIEGHSRLWHWGKQAESRDLERHNKLCALGYQILYLTWADATKYSARSLNTIESMLQRASSKTGKLSETILLA